MTFEINFNCYVCHHKYGITLEQYNEMLTKQNGLCSICKQPETYINHKNKMPEALSVDHCHKTGKIRGLLCKICNQVLGSFKDDISRFESAIKYLKDISSNKFY